MKLRFNENYTVDDFVFVLSTRNFKHISPLVNVSGVHYKPNLNASDELSFTVHKEMVMCVDDYPDGVRVEPAWDKIKDLRLVWVRDLDEYFQISVEQHDTDNPYKTLTLTSLCEAELSQTNLYNTEINTLNDWGVQDREEALSEDAGYISTRFYNATDPEHSLLHRILKVVPHYSIGHVDKSLAEDTRIREFTIDGTSVYDFLTGQCAEQFECLFTFDTKSRKINAYDLMTTCNDCGHRDEFHFICPNTLENGEKCGSTNLSYFGKDTLIYVDRENLSDDIVFSGTPDEIKNCLRLSSGDDDLDTAIQFCNPNGTMYLYRTSEIQEEDMSEELQTALKDYDDKCAEAYPTNLALAQELYDTLDNYYEVAHYMMPTLEKEPVEVYTATYQAGLLTSSALSPTGLESLSERTVTSVVSTAVKNYARVIIKSGYFKVEVPEKDADGNKITPTLSTPVYDEATGITTATWTGRLMVTNYSDEDDVAYTDILSVAITDVTETYLKQKMSKLIASKSEEEGSVFQVLDITHDNYHYGVNSTNQEPDFSLRHKYRLENVINADGSNMVYLSVDDFEHWYYPMTSVFNKDFEDQGETNSWVSGKDFEFSYFGTIDQPINDCKLYYFQIDPEGTGTGICRFEVMGTDEQAMISIDENGDFLNNTSYISGSITDGVLKDYCEQFKTPVVLSHDKPWKIEWSCEGAWGGALLASGETVTAVNRKTGAGGHYLIAKPDITQMFAFGDYNLDRFKAALELYSEARLKSFYTALEGCLSIMQEAGHGEKESDLYASMYVPWEQKYVVCEIIYNQRSAEAKALDDKCKEIRTSLEKAQAELDLEDFLEKKQKGLYTEFCAYRRDGEYSNDNYSSEGLSNDKLFERAQEFIEEAKKQIEKSRTNQFTISTSLHNLMGIPEFAKLIDNFEIGNWIRVGVEGVPYRLRLVSYDLTFDTHQTLNVEFSNLTKCPSIVSDIKSILDSAKSMATNYSYIAKQAEQGKAAQETVNNWLSTGLNSGLVQIQSGKNQTFTMDENGIHGRSYDDITGEYSPKELKIYNNIIAYTDDGWKSTRMVLGEHNYIKYDPAKNEWVTDTGYGNTSDFVTAGYVSGSTIVGGKVYSSNYSNGTNGKVAEGTFIDLDKGSFSFAGGRLTYDGDDKILLTGVNIDWKGVNMPEIEGIGDIETALGNMNTSITALYNGLQFTSISDQYVISPNIVGGQLSIVSKDGTANAQIVDGVLTAKGANITGTITATDGEFSGTVTSTKGNIGGWELSSSGFGSDVTMTLPQFTSSDITTVQNIALGLISLTDAHLTKYDLNKDGIIDVQDMSTVTKLANFYDQYKTCTGTITINPNSFTDSIVLQADSGAFGTVKTRMGVGVIESTNIKCKYINSSVTYAETFSYIDSSTGVRTEGFTGTFMDANGKTLEFKGGILVNGY